jgi:hypothetical protein
MIEGEQEAVTLVRTVVSRNSPVQPAVRCPRAMPDAVSRPDTTAMRLMITCRR